MKKTAFLLAAFFMYASCITAQRLMRKICARCREEDPMVTPKTLIELGIPESYAHKVKAYKGKGCPACGGSGTKGRIAVHEVLVMNDPVKRAILDGKAAVDIKKVAMANGMRSLRQSGLTKLAQGIVNVAEIVKTTSPDSDRPTHSAPSPTTPPQT